MNDTKIHPLLIAKLAGSQRAMGEQFGSIINQVGGADAAMAFYPRMPGLLLAPHSRALRASLRPVVDIALRQLESVRAPELRDRTRAFMAAAGVPASLSRVYGIMDVMQNLVNLASFTGKVPLTRRIAPTAAIAACSSLAVYGEGSNGGRLLHARTFDFPGVHIWERSPALVYCTPKDGQRYGYLTVRAGDVPGVTAFNESGIVVTSHTRFHRDINVRGTMVVDLVHEVVRRATTLDEAEAILREHGSASTWALLVSSAGERRAATFEITANCVSRLEGDARHALATNHYVSPEMQAREVTVSAAFIKNTRGRRAVLERYAARGGLSVTDLQNMLGSHEVADPEGEARAVGGVIAQPTGVHAVVIDAENQRIHIGLGDVPVSQGPWASFDWDFSEHPGQEERRVDLSDTVQRGDEAFNRGPKAEALRSYVNATALGTLGASDERVAALLTAAVESDPNESSYRLSAGGGQLRLGQLEEARRHFAEGIASERDPFHLGQLLLWAARVEDGLENRRQARQLRSRLSDLDDPLLLQAKTLARREAERPVRAKQLKNVSLNHNLGDLHLP